MNGNDKHFRSIRLDELTYDRLQEKLRQISEEYGLLEREVHIVSARTLSPEESIGNPERQDFPLVKGREVMIEARFLDGVGQAFTDMPGKFSGTVREVLELGLSDNFERAIFIATINAVLKHLKWIDRTVHCKNEEPEECARNLVKYVEKISTCPRIAFIGLQPAMVDNLARHFPIRVTDLDPENVGRYKYGVLVEHVDNTEEVLNWSNIVFATGSTLVNNTYKSILKEKPVVFYGVTVAGIAYFTGCQKYCHCGH
ncbi:Rossmann-like domain-containing protein [Desulfoscipio geothermicus]|uniref:Putative heavy-metal chelation n=1 Tax=Desulfoscipio geothermicus DSM 3669 TaxID=1121426 RepID=A0A1I6DTH3_9FIRM|nr:DUF364 domain-containing protein [Desulfoscipio geothermicus]SFR08652.1 Putative heavy-metal chelation [Desulfoscipio geothermicus DSM 3669]